MLLSRLNQIRQRSLESVIRPQNINVNHRLESIGRKLVDGGKEVACSAGTISQHISNCLTRVRAHTYITKSISPSSLTQRSTASFKLSSSRTSTDPIPITLAPGRTVAMSLAVRSVFSTFRPTMHASAPRWTRARTWALQIDPAPPVQKTTLFAGGVSRVPGRFRGKGMYRRCRLSRCR